VLSQFTGGKNVNFAEALLSRNKSGGRHDGITQNQLDNLSPANLLKASRADLDPSNVKQLPAFLVPAIRPGQVIAMATEAGALNAEHAAKVLAEKTKNATRILKAAGEIEQNSAEMVKAFGNYRTRQLGAELARQQANKDFGVAAAGLAAQYNQNAYALQSSIDSNRLQISLAADAYAKVGGFN
jgi:hypothetical protein